MTLIDKYKDWWFWYRHDRIKNKAAPHKFNKRSRAAKIGWQRRKQNNGIS